jgi:hypothetical protein
VTAVFNCRDEALHKTIKSPIAPLFSVASTSSFEGRIDQVLQCFSDNLDHRFVKHGNVFDLGDWLQYFAFDVMGTMTFSKRYGFLDQGEDVGGMLGAIASFMKSVAPVSNHQALLYIAIEMLYCHQKIDN